VPFDTDTVSPSTNASPSATKREATWVVISGWKSSSISGDSVDADNPVDDPATAAIRRCFPGVV
jgi:hypothetical protein